MKVSWIVNEAVAHLDYCIYLLAAREIQLSSISHGSQQIRYNRPNLDLLDVLPQIVRTYNDKPYNRVDHELPVLSIQKFLYRLSRALTAITDRVNRSWGTLRVYFTATREVPSRIVLVQQFDNLRNHFLFRNWCSAPDSWILYKGSA